MGAGVGCFPGLAVTGGGRCRMFSLLCSDGWGGGCVGCFPCFAVMCWGQVWDLCLA